ncbi:hypothetical protein QAD02_021569 [Eretmocerus hayati]|uniref:Uncharacterized protein n=1 Tax=Eretmocerus hayati TaxID=131215 RepID=A0ACC2PQJ4_9HYME|nr:hypothetical protein QAD02_021569 [Eretmocerus hayati]
MNRTPAGLSCRLFDSLPGSMRRVGTGAIPCLRREVRDLRRNSSDVRWLVLLAWTLSLRVGILVGLCTRYAWSLCWQAVLQLVNVKTTGIFCVWIAFAWAPSLH